MMVNRYSQKCIIKKTKISNQDGRYYQTDLKEYNEEVYDIFCKKMEDASGVTTQKRFYMSEYGYANAKDVLLGKTDKLVNAENFDSLN